MDMRSKYSRRRFLRHVSVVSIAPSFLLRNDFFRTPANPVIGFLMGAGYAEMDTAFTGELQRLGFIEGQNISIERRFAKPNSSDGITMAAELAKMDLSLIVAAALPFALEIRKVNPKMPMVIATCPGMVSNGFAESIQYPGGIIPGWTNYQQV